VQDPSEIERAITAFAREQNGGLIVTASSAATRHRKLIIALALQHRLPNVYGFRYYVTSGGLASYGPDIIDVHRRAAAYVDRVLKGEKPADLPVQALPSTSWSSTSRPPRRSVLLFRKLCSAAPTK